MAVETKSLTVGDAIAVLPAVIALAQKVATIISTNTELSIDEELVALEAARMRSSVDIVADADKTA